VNSPKRLTVGIAILCFALLGGALLGGSAVAKKKKKKKSATVTATAGATTIPNGITGPPLKYGFVNVPLTIGKKAKGKVVSPAGPNLTVLVTGVEDALDDVILRLIAPNGRSVGLSAPDPVAGQTQVGPLTFTANSPLAACEAPPPGQCADPDYLVLPPYAGTIGDVGLASFIGLNAKGTWTLRVLNDGDQGALTLNSARLEVPTVSKPEK
jgi:hypothetical protein